MAPRWGEGVSSLLLEEGGIQRREGIHCAEERRQTDRQTVGTLGLIVPICKVERTSGRTLKAALPQVARDRWQPAASRSPLRGMALHRQEAPSHCLSCPSAKVALAGPESLSLEGFPLAVTLGMGLEGYR